MLAFNLLVSLALGVSGVMLIARGNMVGYVLLGCIVVHWTMFFNRRPTT